MPKQTYTAQHPGKFGYPGPNLTWGPSWFHLLTLWLGVRWHYPRENFEIWGPINGQILHSGSLLTVISTYILLQFFICMAHRKKCRLHPYGSLDSTYSYNYLWQHNFIIACFQERNIFELANERQLRSDKPLEEFQGHAHFTFYHCTF
jgi:hypothetical protein